METRQIDDIFEPADLIKNYETPVDKLVVKDDVPERLQLAYRHREEPKQDELVFEAEWICRQISLQSQLNEIEEKGLTGRIRKILEYLRNGKCEIMYIWTYKQHEFTVDASNNIGHYELKLSDMWMIYELDQEWKDVYNKFIAVGNLFDLVSNYHNNSQLIKNFKSQCFNHKHLDFLIDYGIHQIRKWVTFEELRIKLELINIKGTCYSLQGNKTVSYEVQRYGLSKHAESFTLTADQLAQNLLTNTKTNQLPQMNESPIELSKKCVIPEFTPFSDSSSAFQEIMNYMAYEYFNHPVVRKILYADLKSNVVVSTEPTDIGKNLTVYDYYYPSKRITFKKIDDKINRLWMLILESEKKGLITVSFKFDSVSQHHSKGVLRQRLNTFLLLSVDQTKTNCAVNEQWNKVRENIIERLIQNYLIPEFKRFLREELNENAEKWVHGKCVKSLQKIINTKPYRIRDSNQELTEPTSILACSNDEKTVAFVVLKNTGEIQDTFEAKNILKRGFEEDKTQQMLYQTDLELLQRFVSKNSPGVIVVAPKDLKSYNLKVELRNIAENVAKSSDIKEPFVMWGNLQISFAFAKSSLSNNVNSDYSQLFKEAISTGRFIQNPLAETTNLWSENEKKNALLSLNLNPFQHLTNQYKLQTKIENLLVEQVNMNGVDLHACINYKHLSNQLQFVCGLGPRKATKLLEKLKADEETFLLNKDTNEPEKGGDYFGTRKKGDFEGDMLGASKFNRRKINLGEGDAEKRKRRFLNKRSCLLENGRMENLVYVNCIGFLKLFGKYSFFNAEDNSDEFEWLDFTRIHPDDYPMAKKIASSVYPGEPGQENNCVLKLLKDSSRLEDYNLDDYGKHLSEMMNANMNIVINFLKKELKNPFGDSRADFPTKQKNQKIFYRLTNESKYKFLENAIVTAKIISVNDFGLKVLTSCELTGTIKLSDNKEEQLEHDGKNQYVIGNYVRAKIRKINYDKMVLDLSIKNKDLLNHIDFIRQNKVLEKYDLNESYTFRILKEEDFPKSSLDAKQRIKRFEPRKINHPYFKNIGIEKAEDFLNDRFKGEFIFRPSSKGPGYLNLTWRIFDCQIIHIVIKEGVKNSNEEISKSLLLDKQEYDSIDSIVSNFIKPCNKFVENIYQNEKFTTNGVDKVKDLLISKKQENLNSLPYMFTIAKEYPQFIILSYSTTKAVVKHELIKIKPQGLAFHSQMFSTIEYLIRFFKEKIDHYIHIGIHHL